MKPYVFISPATRGLSLALTRYYLANTTMPVFATHRALNPTEIRSRILDRLPNDIAHRLTLIPLELTDESSIKAAAEALASALPSNARLHRAWITGGVLLTNETRAEDIDYTLLLQTFQINVISHLLIMKHFARFLPEYRINPSQHSAPRATDLAQTQNSSNSSGYIPQSHPHTPASKWIHISSGLSSLLDNYTGSFYSYRVSKSALNQAIKTFDIQLQLQQHENIHNHVSTLGTSIVLGVVPGTVKTDLSKGFYKGAPVMLEPEDAARQIVRVVDELGEKQRGAVWDWAGRRVPW
ncbi:hypothetical protein M422DRAFT_35904 [Sphaerobolus stellatus SS14]|uniref:Uncharacterized protein n=1 Tax=Sphaerobolus stellatus (strain SS14) TaxID=990650 RepID=A0A0C9UCI8_SPHS4|nr:hypothetical protein M422DRAFT_35904 [Sphaerobolus stellatus SS14]